MSKKLNEFQNATVGMTVGVIEVRVEFYISLLMAEATRHTSAADKGGNQKVVFQNSRKDFLFCVLYWHAGPP